MAYPEAYPDAKHNVFDHFGGAYPEAYPEAYPDGLSGRLIRLIRKFAYPGTWISRCIGCFGLSGLSRRLS